MTARPEFGAAIAVEVTQADREAAAEFAWSDGDVGTQQLRYDIRRGKRDDHAAVQAFARHRTSTALPLAHPAAPQGEEGAALAQHARRGALVERIGTVADLLCENPLPGDLGDAAYDLLRQAAAQIASDRKRLAPAAIASGREGAE